MPSEISFHETHLPEFLLFAMAAGEPTRQDPSAPKVLAAQTRGDGGVFFAYGQIKGLSAAWTRSWQLLESTLWSCWLVTELFSSSSPGGQSGAR